MNRKAIAFGLMTLAASAAWAQLPPDAVDLALVKIPEQLKPIDLCPVYLEPADPELPSWTHEGVEYRGAKPDAREKFLADPAAYLARHDEARYVRNFMEVMSRIWCPVTDEVTPGGMLEWEQLGYVWESCCAFCDESVMDSDFPPAIERLRARAEKSYALTGGIYTEGASSPVEGAIAGLGPPVAAAAREHEAAAIPALESEPAAIAEPAWLRGVELEPTYLGGVGLIFANRCADCHRPGETAPMPLTNFQEIRAWAGPTMRNAIALHTMPPWPADPAIGRFANDRRLSEKEHAVLLRWADTGYREGTGGAEPTGGGVEGWTIGPPDAIFALPEYAVGSEVVGEFREIEIATDFAEDRWIVATEAHAGETLIVQAIDGGPLGSYRPGATSEALPEGYGYRLPAGARIKVRVHYLKDAGFEMTDPNSRLGVRFAADPAGIRHEVRADPMAAEAFTIAPGAERTEVTARFTFPADGEILSLMPTMLARGKSARYKAILPDGSERELLSIPIWKASVRYRYQLAEPMAVPAGTVVELTGVFDNSIVNILNPDPAAEVKSGPAGEVLEGWIGYSLGAARSSGSR